MAYEYKYVTCINNAVRKFKCCCGLLAQSPALLAVPLLLLLYCSVAQFCCYHIDGWCCCYCSIVVVAAAPTAYWFGVNPQSTLVSALYLSALLRVLATLCAFSQRSCCSCCCCWCFFGFFFVFATPMRMRIICLEKRINKRKSLKQMSACPHILATCVQTQAQSLR